MGAWGGVTCTVVRKGDREVRRKVFVKHFSDKYRWSELNNSE